MESYLDLEQEDVHPREARVSLIDGKIDILNRDVVEASPAKRIFRTVSAILSLVRVGAPILHLSVNHHISLMVQPGQDDRQRRFRTTVWILFRRMRDSEDCSPRKQYG